MASNWSWGACEESVGLQETTSRLANAAMQVNATERIVLRTTRLFSIELEESSETTTQQQRLSAFSLTPGAVSTKNHLANVVAGDTAGRKMNRTVEKGG
jgi:hypothetical protein